MPKSRSSRPLPTLRPAPRQRKRHDGWTPERQLAFIEALAASGCVAEACKVVGMSRSAAYALRVEPGAQQFRIAWDAALDLAIRRLADACFARAMEGEVVPHYYQGQLIGEHRRYDNRLAMFLLRYRDPLRYAATLDQMVYSGHPEQAGIAFAKARNRLLDEAHGADPLPPREGEPETGAPPYRTEAVHAVAARQAEEALVASGARVGGSMERRARIDRLRAAHHRKAGAEEDSAAGALSRLSTLIAEMKLEPPP